MVKILINRFFLPAVFLFPCVLMLAGCPGPGDRMRFDETAQVSVVGEKVCFSVAEPQDYQPNDIGINPRGTPSKNKNFNFSPDLKITEGKLCIPPSFYHFPNKGQLIVEYILTSAKHDNEPRNFVVTLEVNNGHVYNVTPTEREIFLPYCRYTLDTPLAACQL